MFLRTSLRLLVTILLSLASVCTIYLYLYPLFHGCAFPFAAATGTTTTSPATTKHWPSFGGLNEPGVYIAPFRLLVLADPQLEGDSSLPNPENGFLRRLARHRERVFKYNLPKSRRKQEIKKALKQLFLGDIPEAVHGLRKQLDLFGNDYYLAHIYRTLHWWTKPTHVTVLGDLIGSQWVTDEEFESRAWRYWKRVFTGGRRVEDEVSSSQVEEVVACDTQDEDKSCHKWENRIINIAGNHDIGYAGDISRTRIERFEEHFGRADWDIRFNLPASAGPKNTSQTPSLHVVILNDLTFDTPALDSKIQSASYTYLNSIITERSHPVEDKSSFTLLLTHVPLYKSQGVCVDSPFFEYYDWDHPRGDYRRGGLKEQNHLSDHVSRSGILEGLYGMNANREAAGNGKGRKGLILTGHDHEGCDVWHYIPEHTADQDNHESKSDSWNSVPWADANISASHTGIREITLRSMMGQYGGNAGLLSFWFDSDSGEWQYDMQMCRLGVQHIWWGIHILDLVTICLALFWLVSSALSSKPAPQPATDAKATSTKR